MDMTTLQQSLVNAKMVMNKVDGGNFTKSEMPMTGNQPNINMESVQQHLPPESSTPLSSMPSAAVSSPQPTLTPKANITENQIKNSKLPDVIKAAMINNPIPDIPFNGGGAGLTPEFLSGVKDQMSKQGMPTSKSSPQRQMQEEIQEQVNVTNSRTKKLSSKNLKSIIKESVKELLEEVVTTRINESIGLRKDMGENFQFRVGDKVFYGKITSTKTIK